MAANRELKSRTYNDALNDHTWIVDNGIEIHEKYRGEWIAVANNQLLAHGYDFEKVVASAQELCPKPTFMQVPFEDTIIYE